MQRTIPEAKIAHAAETLRQRSSTEPELQVLIADTNRAMVEASAIFWGESQAGARVANHLLKQFKQSANLAETLGWLPDQILEALAVSRKVLASSALFNRCQRWERGYPGDFETIECLAGGINHSAPGTLGWHFEEVALRSSAGEQHRNKLNHQTGQVAKTVGKRQDARILALACGGGWDWRKATSLLAGFTGEIVLQDCDPAALVLAGQRLQCATDRYRLIPGNPFWTLESLVHGPRFDLILASGLFDYLNDRIIVRMLHTAFQQLTVGGTIVFSNIVEGNQWRLLMDYGANWNVIERNEDHLRRICTAAGIPASAVRVIQEPSGVTLIAEVVRNA